MTLHRILRKTILPAAFALLPWAAFGQDAADSTADEFNPDTGLASEHYEKMSRRQASYRVNMEGYVGGRKGNTVWGFGANPEVNVPVGRKADITAGISVMQSYYNGADFIPWSVVSDGSPSKRGSTTDAILYVAASYYVNPRLTVRASGFVNLSGNGHPFAPQKGFSVGADYRFSRRAWISFDYTYIEGGVPYPFGGYGGYYGRPVGMGGIYNPFGSRGWHNPWL